MSGGTPTAMAGPSLPSAGDWSGISLSDNGNTAPSVSRVYDGGL